MKKYIFVATFVLLALCAVSWGYFTEPLLTNEDLLLEQTDRENGSAMSSALNTLPAWQSFNEWQCFRSENLSIECVIYDESTLVPSIVLETETEGMSFDLHAEDQQNCEETKYNWQNLINSGPETCIYAALMPEAELNGSGEKPHSLWYIHSIKGSSGYWTIK